MSVLYATAVKTSRMVAVRDRFVDGTLEIGTVGMSTVLAIFTLSSTAGTVNGAVWSLGFVASTVQAAAGGTAGAARIKRSAANGGAEEISGLTVATANADLNIDNTTIVQGQDVTLSAAAITHAA